MATLKKNTKCFNIEIKILLFKVFIVVVILLWWCYQLPFLFLDGSVETMIFFFLFFFGGRLADLSLRS